MLHVRSLNATGFNQETGEPVGSTTKTDRPRLAMLPDLDQFDWHLNLLKKGELSLRGSTAVLLCHGMARSNISYIWQFRMIRYLARYDQNHDLNELKSVLKDFGFGVSIKRGKGKHGRSFDQLMLDTIDGTEQSAYIRSKPPIEASILLLPPLDNIRGAMKPNNARKVHIAYLKLNVYATCKDRKRKERYANSLRKLTALQSGALLEAVRRNYWVDTYDLGKHTGYRVRENRVQTPKDEFGTFQLVQHLEKAVVAHIKTALKRARSKEDKDKWRTALKQGRNYVPTDDDD